MTELLRKLLTLLGLHTETVDPEALDDPETERWWAIQDQLEPHGVRTEVCQQCLHYWHIPLTADGTPDPDLFVLALIEHCLDDRVTHEGPLIRFEELT